MIYWPKPNIRAQDIGYKDITGEDVKVQDIRVQGHKGRIDVNLQSALAFSCLHVFGVIERENERFSFQWRR